MHLDYYTVHMSMERMRISDAHASERRWREDLAQKNPIEEYRRVQKERIELEAKFDKNVEGAMQTPAPILGDREQALQASREMHKRIEELRAEEDRLKYAIKKSGGIPGDHTV